MNFRDDKIIFVMVGLPGRGKSYIAKKLVGYLSWLGLQAQTFNVGNYRRKVVVEDQSQSFFDSTNQQAKQLREHLALAVLDEALNWLHQGGHVAVFDATNTTNDRRRGVLEHIHKFQGCNFNVIFLESICDDKAVLESNFQQKILNSPDYKNMAYEEAKKDLAQRIENYQKVYETIQDDSLSYIKLINLQSKVVCNKIFGHLAQRIVAFLMSIHIEQRPIWLTRTGHSENYVDINGKFNEETPLQTYLQLRIEVPDISSRGNHLNEDGKLYAKKLSCFIQHQCRKFYQKENPCPLPIVYSSTLPRALETIEHIKSQGSHVILSSLNMIDTGIVDSTNVNIIKEEMSKDPLNYRLPCGESYSDLIQRLDPLVVDLERQRNPVLVVSHLSTLQALYAYFSDQPLSQAPLLSIPSHTVIQLTPNQYGWVEKRFNLDEIELESLKNPNYTVPTQTGVQRKNNHYGLCKEKFSGTNESVAKRQKTE